ncbi:MAG: alanine--glyoxylate aminotransferase family protein [Candidatus Bathyarchaeia archaeon]
MRYGELNPPNRILLGPGPSNVHPIVLRAMSSPLVGHLDPYFMELMDEVMELLREVFATKNKVCFPISGTGMAGMEAAIVNLVQPGDEVIVGSNGFFGQRMAEIVRRCQGKPIEVFEEWGRAINPEKVEEALSSSKANLVCVVHAETSTGVLQPLDRMAKMVRAHDALLLVDAVTSLSGCELKIDEMGIDVCYSGSQKCLNCPPGLAPITFNERAMERVRHRRTKVQSWYLDVSLIEQYWSEGRAYHHTAPISMIYALREALRIVAEEGLEARWARHKRNRDALIRGIEEMGLRMFPPENRCPSLNAISVPEGVEDAMVRRFLLDRFNMEIGSGLGPLKGKIWRVGLMGINSSEQNVILFLGALERALRAAGFRVKGSGAKAAIEAYGERG